MSAMVTGPVNGPAAVTDGLAGAMRLLSEVRARRIVVFTGAGVSTDSGIPDFRSPGGLWTRTERYTDPSPSKWVFRCWTSICGGGTTAARSKRAIRPTRSIRPKPAMPMQVKWWQRFFSPRLRTGYLGAVMTVQGLGAAFSTTLAGWVAQETGYAVAFAVLGGIGAIAIPIFLMMGTNIAVPSSAADVDVQTRTAPGAASPA